MTPVQLNYESRGTQRRKSHWIVITCIWLPIALALLEIPWGSAVCLGAWFILGDPEPTKAQSYAVGAVVLLPFAFGILLGMTTAIWLILNRRIVGPGKWAVWYCGLAGCCFEMFKLITG